MEYSAPAPAAPTRDRPTMPEGYGLPDDDSGLLEWSAVQERLVASENFWLCTVRPDGTPHSVPRWGVWLDGRFWYEGALTTQHAVNLRTNPAVTLTLESGVQAVIVEGTSAPTRADADGLGARLAEAFGKYRGQGYSPGAGSWAGPQGGGLRVITPRRALAWFSFPADATRFRW